MAKREREGAFFCFLGRVASQSLFAPKKKWVELLMPTQITAFLLALSRFGPRIMAQPVLLYAVWRKITAAERLDAVNWTANLASHPRSSKRHPTPVSH